MFFRKKIKDEATAFEPVDENQLLWDKKLNWLIDNEEMTIRISSFDFYICVFSPSDIEVYCGTYPSYYGLPLEPHVEGLFPFEATKKRLYDLVHEKANLFREQEKQQVLKQWNKP